jgi:L-amino acid N-acyltransferase YncA
VIAIRPLQSDDWEAVRAIYQEGIESGWATFETTSPDWESWDAKHRADCRLVAEIGGTVAGWAALAPVSSREAYAGVAEVTVYVGSIWQRRGVGAALFRELIEVSEDAGLWTLQAVMFPENKASVALHSKLGFRTVGRRNRIGKLGGKWRDTVVLERRSPRVGS